MCGICGIIHKNKQVDESDLKMMLPYLHERGPDNEGIYLSDNIGFGHTRLSVIDLTIEANQPMINDTNSLVITFNGEIYNYQTLKGKLEDIGVRFHTHSDTEVILKAYEHWGIENTLSQLDGMFAFAIFNRSSNKIIFGRDRFGKKPLYYYLSENSISFSSNIRSIWVKNKDHLSIDWQAIDYYLTELSMPQPKSIWQEVKQLPPAHYAILDIKSFSFTAKKYWAVPTHNEIVLKEEDVLEKTTDLLSKAINKRLVSDVPLGFFLSGGVDSGLIVALAAQMSSERIKTLTVSVEDSTFDESEAAQLVASKFNTDHTNVHVSANIAETIEDMIDYMGEPFADSSIVPSYLINKAAKANMTVVLSGDGGDELFGGYDDYGLAFRTDSFVNDRSLGYLRRPRVLIDKFMSRLSQRENLGSLDHYSQIPEGEKLLRKMAFMSSEKEILYQEQKLKSASGFTSEYLNEIWRKNKDASFTMTLMKSSLETRLLNDYLVKIDRASMRNSVEIRSPFLDKDLAEFAFSIDYRLKFTKTENKKILRNLARDHIGEASGSRDKTGFGIPIHTWLREDLKLWRDGLINSFKKREILEEKYLNRTISEFDSYINAHTHKIWAIICLELWFQKFYD